MDIFSSLYPKVPNLNRAKPKLCLEYDNDNVECSSISGQLIITYFSPIRSTIPGASILCVELVCLLIKYLNLFLSLVILGSVILVKKPLSTFCDKLNPNVSRNVDLFISKTKGCEDVKAILFLTSGGVLKLSILRLVNFLLSNCINCGNEKSPISNSIVLYVNVSISFPIE